MLSEQITNTVLLVKPKCFARNPQTAGDNHFQTDLNLDPAEATAYCHREFDVLVALLRKKGISVILFEQTNPDAIDAVFSNNWLSTHEGGVLVLYPVFAENRRIERSAILVDDLKQRFYFNRVVDLTPFEKKNKFCEGTGSMILDRVNKIAYSALSERTHPEVVEAFCEALGYQSLNFTATQDHQGQRAVVYHANVMLSMGDCFVSVCLDSVQDAKERQLLIESFERTGKEIIDLSEGQMAEFAGNSLLLKSPQGPLLVMSTRAHASLEANQIKTYEKYCNLAHCDLNIIERLGGGSARCMMTEIFT